MSTLRLTFSLNIGFLLSKSLFSFVVSTSLKPIVTAVLTGWTLSDSDSHVYNFPGAFSLAPGAAMQVWTKSGANSATNLYWGSEQGIWTNTGDTAYLRNGGTLVNSCSYSGGGCRWVVNLTIRYHMMLWRELMQANSL